MLFIASCCKIVNSLQSTLFIVTKWLSVQSLWHCNLVFVSLLCFMLMYLGTSFFGYPIFSIHNLQSLDFAMTFKFHRRPGHLFFRLLFVNRSELLHSFHSCAPLPQMVMMTSRFEFKV